VGGHWAAEHELLLLPRMTMTMLVETVLFCLDSVEKNNYAARSMMDEDDAQHTADSIVQYAV